YRNRLRAILESAFSTHRESDPVLFRGCYFVATGEDRQEQAFSAGLLRGPRSRILADHRASTWSQQALLDDRRYARIAWAVGAVGLLLTLLPWLVFIIERNRFFGVVGIAAIAITWVIVLCWPVRDRGSVST